MQRHKLISQLKAAYGKRPDEEYFAEDMDGIRAYHEHRLGKGVDPFMVDDTTWRDLAMDDVFKRVNGTLSSSGEQVLYHMLRTPAVTPEAYETRRALISQMEEDANLRLSLQRIFARLGKRRAANSTQLYHPTRKAEPFLFLAPLLVGSIIGCFIGACFAQAFLLPLVVLIAAGAFYHELMTHQLANELLTVSYAVGMTQACKKVRRLSSPALRNLLTPLFEAERRARSIQRMGSVSNASGNDLAFLVNLVLQVDLLTYRRLKKKLALHEADIFIIHETLGTLDAAIAVASYRQSITGWCAPEIVFDETVEPFYAAVDMAHPLIEKSVTNSIEARRPMLITGSNASGKSTFLKGVVLNAILAQGLCTALCASYRATAFRIYTSMAISDNVFAGDSYFVAEIKSIKRIADAAARGERLLCAVDEVLRGTNTIERIAASSELLRTLAQGRTLCFAATHDLELCGLLAKEYRQGHFEERIEGNDVLFDFLLREGPATTRNAIRLLRMMGFDEAMVARAEARAAADMVAKGAGL